MQTEFRSLYEITGKITDHNMLVVPAAKLKALTLYEKLAEEYGLSIFPDLEALAAEIALLRTGYAAARLEIESLQARIKTMAEEHADELMVAHMDGRMCAAQPIDAMLGEQAELRRLSDCCPELNLSNYGPDDVDELNWWAIEVSQCIDRALAAQPAGAQQPGAAYAELPSYEHQRAIMEAERNASLDEYSRIVPLTSTESMIYERAFTNGWNRHAHHGQAPAQAAPENIRSILTRCRDFIDTTKAPAYPAGADLADEIDVLLAAQPAPQQPADPWRKAVTDACMPTEACFNGKDPAATINNLIDWHLQNERFHVAQRAQPAAPQQEAQEPAAQEDKSHE